MKEPDMADTSVRVHPLDAIDVAKECLKEANGDVSVAVGLLGHRAAANRTLYDNLAAHGAWWAIEAVQRADSHTWLKNRMAAWGFLC
jgi:hypothetical protein